MLRGMEDEEFWPRLPAPSACISPWVYRVWSHILVPSTAGEPGAGQTSQGDLLQHRRGLKIAASSSRGAKKKHPPLPLHLAICGLAERRVGGELTVVGKYHMRRRFLTAER